jgi:hypothetical protein
MEELSVEKRFGERVQLGVGVDEDNASLGGNHDVSTELLIFSPILRIIVLYVSR